MFTQAEIDAERVFWNAELAKLPNTDVTVVKSDNTTFDTFGYMTSQLEALNFPSFNERRFFQDNDGTAYNDAQLYMQIIATADLMYEDMQLEAYWKDDRYIFQQVRSPTPDIAVYPLSYLLFLSEPMELA